MPGVLNGHVHLEFSGFETPVGGGEDFAAWVGSLFADERARGPRAPEVWSAGIAEVLASGTSWVSDVGGGSAEAMRASGLAGICHHELLGFDAAMLPDAMAKAQRDGAVGREVVERASPHAMFSTAPALVEACCRPGLAPATMHLGETEQEAAFLLRREGPLAELLDRLGRDWRPLAWPQRSAVENLANLGVLGPGLLLVHGVFVSAEDKAKVAEAGAGVCFCPRSNLHITGQLPDVPAWLEAGVRCVIGTDSRASSPDLDVWKDVAVLAEAYPQVPTERWVRMVTDGAAEVFGAKGFGRLEVGSKGGIYVWDADDLQELGRWQGTWWTPPQGARAGLA